MLGEPRNGLNGILAYMLKLPVGVCVTCMELMLKGMREFQGIFDEAADNLVAEATRRPAEGPLTEATTEASHSWDEVPGWDQTQRTLDFEHPMRIETHSREKEKPAMTDQDLGGDDAKNVSYWITFIKPDLVATLQEMETETIDYPTDAGSYGGLKIGEFLQRLAQRPAIPAQRGVKFPTEWKNKSLPKGYDVWPPLLPPPAPPPQRLLDIPPADRKYIKFNYKVNWRQPVPEAEREKEKVEVLREIRDKL